MQFSLNSFFCFTIWMNLVQASNQSPDDCLCSVVSKTRIHHSKIEKYTIQNGGICPFSAIVFRTEKGKTICSDPNDEWAKHVLRLLEKRRTLKLQPITTYPKEGTSSWTTPSASSKLCGAITITQKRK
uniref:Chemokine interleukin-8-like domain-containing protein n=1 Tax=Poecilia formosa TaxID=48698 RepID=A0A087Y570_POEFO